MKRLTAILLASVFLVGCRATAPEIIRETVTITEYKYVIVKVPESALTIDPAPEIPNPETATDRQIAEFILEQEGRAKKLVERLTSVMNYHVGVIERLIAQGIKRENIIE